LSAFYLLLFLFLTFSCFFFDLEEKLHWLKQLSLQGQGIQEELSNRQDLPLVSFLTSLLATSAFSLKFCQKLRI
jgi:hypothetical protein